MNTHLFSSIRPHETSIFKVMAVFIVEKGKPMVQPAE